jgi:DNA-binding Xre family transcriptional regulator
MKNPSAARLRELKNISCQQLGDSIGITKITAFKYFLGMKRIPSRQLTPIAKAFGCDVSDLLAPPGAPLPKCARQSRR